MTDIEAYSKPVAALLKLGERPLNDEEWRDYRSDGITLDHVPELITLATDEDLLLDAWPDPSMYAPIHAWRALGQLQAEGAIEPLLKMLSIGSEADLEAAYEDIPEALALIGAPALPALSTFVNDPQEDAYARGYAAEAIRKIGVRDPVVRDQCVTILAERLAQARPSERGFNAGLIYELTRLHAVEAAPVIEKAFADNVVDLSIQGDWESAQVRLGLLDERVTPEPNWFQAEARAGGRPEVVFPDIPGEQDGRVTFADDHAKRKKARKQAKATKKKQRKPKKKKRK